MSDISDKCLDVGVRPLQLPIVEIGQFEVKEISKMEFPVPAVPVNFSSALLRLLRVRSQ